MRKTFCFVATLALLAVAQVASATRVVLIAHNQRSGAGTGQPSVLRWDGCANYAQYTNCINPANAGMAAAGITPSTAVWDWDAATGVLSMTGTFNSASTISSQSMGPMVIGDKVTDLVIDTTNNTTSAATYACGEGTFLAGVGAHGCANVSTGGDFTYNSSMAYNVGGDANCVQRTLGGDDVSTGNPRTLATTAGGGGCDPGDGAFLMYEVTTDNTATLGGQLVVSNNTDLFAAGVNYLTFQAVASADDDGPFDALESVALPIDVLANDTLFTDPVTVTVTTPPGKGTALVNGSPGPAAGITITYTAGAGQSGADSFVYQVTDGASTDTATVTLNVLTGGANDDTASTTRNAASFSINVGGNDSGFTDPVTITLETAPNQGGTATPPADGPAATRAFTYTPGTKPAGTATYTETFVYRITGANALTATADVTVTVNNAVPVASDAALTISTQGFAPGSTTATLNAATFPGNNIGNTPSTVTATNGANGTTSVAGNVVTYTPSATFFAGTDTFTYTITDSDPGTAETDTGTATVTIADRTPDVGDGAITTAQDTAAAPFALTVTLGNGSQAQHTGPTVTTNGTKGSCALAGNSVTYTPNAGQSGADSCVVSITDGDGDTGTGTLSITITPAPGGGGGGGGGLLPGGGGALDGFGLALLAGAAWLGRRRRAGR